MAFETFRAASKKAKAMNILFLVFNLMAWISCCVGFGGVLMTSSKRITGGTLEVEYRWDKLHTTGFTAAYDSSDCDVTACDKCKTGGRAFLAFQVLAFVGLTFALFLTIVRFLGVTISKLEPTRKVLFGELVLTGSNLVSLFLSVSIFGGTCFHAVAQIEGFSVVGTGFGFTIACFFALIINLVLIYLIRSDSASHLGSAGGSSYITDADSTTNYNPPASYQYAKDPAAAAYAGSYNGDVMPQQDGIAL